LTEVKHKSINHCNLLPIFVVEQRGVLDTTLCDKVCQWLVAGGWFSPGTPVSCTNKTNHHDIAEILLKVTLNTITPPVVKQKEKIHPIFN